MADSPGQRRLGPLSLPCFLPELVVARLVVLLLLAMIKEGGHSPFAGVVLSIIV